LRPSAILALNRLALEGIERFAGNYRPGTVEISGSRHQPPDAFLVPSLVEDLCDYVNERWEGASPVHLAAYVLWRLNWIHAFFDGNGRTSRAVSYLVLCVRLGYRLPGRTTIPELIADDKKPYYKALEKADQANEAGKVDVSALEELLAKLLAEQLALTLREATGGAWPPSESKREREEQGK